MASNAALGKLILAATFSAFLYYVLWVAVLPFIVIDARDGKRGLLFCLQHRIDRRERNKKQPPQACVEHVLVCASHKTASRN